MPEDRTAQPLLATLRSLLEWLRAEGVQGVIIGGVAASLLGRPRTTRDVDALVLLPENRWKGFLAAGKPFGFMPRRPDAFAFARQAKVLLARHVPSSIDVDIGLGSLPFELDAVARAIAVQVEDVRIPLPTPEDLIVFKAVAHRPRDLADIEGILHANENLDLRRVRRWLRQFSSALDAPEILESLENLVASRRKRKTVSQGRRGPQSRRRNPR